MLFKDIYRAPIRDITNTADNILLSPASGKILDIKEHSDTHNEISIFLNLHDIHTQYIPMDGIIKEMHYCKGTFYPAGLATKSKYNEQMRTVVETKYGDITLVQIAGVIATRIRTFIKLNQKVDKGEKFGLIKFGSRVNIIIPKQFEITCKKNDKLMAGKSEIAEYISI
jgi:phosphatidylserine decarboxylase